MKEYGFMYQGQWVQPGSRVKFNDVDVVAADKVGCASCYRFETACGLVLHYEHQRDMKWKRGDQASFWARVRNIRRCAKTGRLHADVHYVMSEDSRLRMQTMGWKYQTA